MLNHKKRIIFLVCLTAIAIMSWQHMRNNTTVETSTVRKGTAVNVVYATGTIEPTTYAQISPEVTGRLIAFQVEEGQKVKKGDILAQLDDREQRADVARFEAMVENDRIELNRAQTLWQRKSGSREAYDKAQSLLAQDEAQLTAAHERLARRTLRALFDGTILRREGDIGEVVTPSTLLFEMGQTDNLRAALEVDEEDIPHIFTGQKVLLSADAFPNQIFEGAVADITPAGDSTNKSYRVRIPLPVDTPLPIGMTVEANLIAQEHPDALLVPTGAVITTAGSPSGKAVFRIDNHRVHFTPVTVGIIGTEQTEILSGLKEGDIIITQPSPTLGDGDFVSASTPTTPQTN